MRHFERAAAIAAEAGFQSPRASALQRFAELQLFVGEFDRALATLNEILELTGRTGDANPYVIALYTRAGYHLDRRGDVAAAHKDLEAAEQKRSIVAAPVQEDLTDQQAKLLLHQRRCEEALRLVETIGGIRKVEALWCLGRREEARRLPSAS